jgi:CRP-like cAMP-binding protein
MFESRNPANRVLASLSLADLRLIEPHLQAVKLSQGQRLYRLGDPLEYIVFPHDCLISITATIEADNDIECAVVGPEGIVGAYAGSGIDHAVTDATVQIVGWASRIAAADFRDALSQSETLRAQAARCDALLMAQMHQTVACNAVHDVAARMCRWLLEFDDRSGGSRFAMTQDLLAKMLGVRRTTVTLAAKGLQQAGAFRWRRGYVYVQRRDLIADGSCGCYERVKMCADRLAPPVSARQPQQTLATPVPLSAAL